MEIFCYKAINVKFDSLTYFSVFPETCVHNKSTPALSFQNTPVK